MGEASPAMRSRATHTQREGEVSREIREREGDHEGKRNKGKRQKREAVDIGRIGGGWRSHCTTLT
jgi:hypothetical protein